VQQVEESKEPVLVAEKAVIEEESKEAVRRRSRDISSNSDSVQNDLSNSGNRG
jgi:hypothetical protein